jgi:catalase
MSGIAGEKNDEIINRQRCHFFRADPELGQRVVDGLGVDVSKVMDELEHA